MQLCETVPSREFGWHLQHVESSVVLWSKWICSLIKGGFVCFLNLLWIRTDSHSRHFCTIRSWRKSYIGTNEPCNRCNSICYNSNSYWLLLHVLQLNKYNLNNYGVNWIFIWDTLFFLEPFPLERHPQKKLSIAQKGGRGSANAQICWHCFT